MQRFAFKMKLKSGCKDEYIRRHKAIWPELKAVLTASGVRDYTIYLDAESNTLFAVQSQYGEKSSQDLGENPIVRRWWKYMSDIMETNPDSSPVSIPLEEVFHMD
ncbi:MAG: L-rhamnose mutarotase [Candidatus Kryptoniota bacterium]